MVIQKDCGDDGAAYYVQRVGCPPVADALETPGIRPIKEYIQD